jgi:hypothetical protein
MPSGRVKAGLTALNLKRGFSQNGTGYNYRYEGQKNINNTPNRGIRKALEGQNFSAKTIRAYGDDLAQFAG